MTAPLAAAEDHFPIGAVVGPAGGSSVPSTQEQHLHYDWLRRTGFDIIQHEVLPLAGGWLAWSHIQPEPDRFDWGAYDSAVADTESAGLTVLLEVFTWDQVPAWLLAAHPDAYMQTPLSGADQLSRVIRDDKLDTPTWSSIAHPALRTAACEYVRRLAQRYRKRTCVKGYIIGEEKGLSGIWPPGTYYGIDFSPAMCDAYHHRLRAKYQTIDQLNQAWNCPGRYRSFEEIKWHRGWAYDHENYRPEWIEYYLTVQQEFADFHNALARSIHQGDPDALVMASGFTMMSAGRVGHGAHLPLMTDLDAVAYKSYWHDNRTFVDYLTGISSGKQVWCSNLSERETTTGPVEQQRFLEPRYVRRQLWAGVAHGLKGAFVWHWAPPTNPGVDKMKVLASMPDGSVETIPALAEVRSFRTFMRRWWPYLKQFQPPAPSVVALDANLTFIGQFWNHTDPTPLRAAMSGSSAANRYTTTFNLLSQLGRTFTVGTEQTITDRLAQDAARVFCLTGCDYLTPAVVDLAHQWVQAGRPLIIGDQSGTRDPLGRATNSLADLHDDPHVLVLRGWRWDREETERQKLRAFINRHVPLPYATDPPELAQQIAVDMMTSDQGDELAVIVRHGPMGRLQDTAQITLPFTRAHRQYLLLDPFAAPDTGHTQSTLPAGTTVDCVLPAYQDVMLIVGLDALPPALTSP